MTNRLARIDALRGVAILMVLQLHHLSSSRAYQHLGLPDWTGALLGGGRAGVDLFFVLSAYLLTSNLLRHRERPMLAPTFYLRRAFRILPMYLLLLTAGMSLATVLYSGGATPGAWLWRDRYPLWIYLTFQQNWVSGWQGYPVAQFFGPTWSLAVEEHFYLLLPLLATRLPPRRLAIVAAVWIIAALPIRALLFGDVSAVAAYAWTIGRMDTFGWGILLALVPMLWPDLPKRLDPAFAIKLGAMIFVVASTLSPELLPGMQETILYPSWTALASALATYGVVHRREASASGAVVRALEWCGRRCYSLYLIHMPVMGLVFLLAGKDRPLGVDASSFALLGLSAAISFALADVCYRRIELPFMTMAERFAPYRGQPTQRTSAATG